MTPKTRNLLIGLLAAVAAALTAYLQACTPAELAKARSAAELAPGQAECILAATRPAVEAPKELSLSEALEMRAAVQACFAAAPTSADAGAN